MKCSILVRWFWRCSVAAFLLLGASCGGAEFSAATTSDAYGTSLGAEGEASEVIPAKNDAGSTGDAHGPASSSAEAGAAPDALPVEAATPSEAAVIPICNTQEEFDRECALYLHHELEAGTCWGRCGTCYPAGSTGVCIEHP